MSAQPAAFVENRADYERSVQWARERANANDETLEICPVCMCEVDVDPQPHRPGCPAIGKPRATTEPVLGGLQLTVPLVSRPPVRAGAAFNDDTGLDALERMDAGEPQEPVLEEAAAVGEDAVSGAAPSMGEPERVAASSSTRAWGRGRKWTEETVIAAIVCWNDEHGEPPTSVQWAKAGDDHPSQSSVIKVFGKWTAAIAAAGFEPRKRGGQRGSRSTSDLAASSEVEKPEEVTSEERGTRRTVGAGRGPRSSDLEAGDLDAVRASALQAINSIFDLLDEVTRAVA